MRVRRYATVRKHGKATDQDLRARIPALGEVQEMLRAAHGRCHLSSLAVFPGFVLFQRGRLERNSGRNMKQKQILAAVLLAATPLAQAATDSLGEVVVTATRTEQP